MKVSPDTVLVDTGVQPVLDRLRSLVQSVGAIRKIESLSFAASLSEVKHRLTLASELQHCLKFDDPLPFRATADVESSVLRSRPEGTALNAEELMAIRDMAVTGRRCVSYFTTRSTKYPETSQELSSIIVSSDVESSINSTFDDDGHVRDSASDNLRQIRKRLQRARAALRTAIMKVLRHASKDGFAADDQPTVRGGRMVIPVHAEAKRKISGFIQDVSATGQTVYIEPTACLEQNNLLKELETAELREIEKIRQRLTDVVRQNADQLLATLESLAEFETRKAIAVLANELDAVVPSFNTRGEIQIRDGRNPELLIHFRQKNPDRQVIPLNLELGGAFHTLIISGPNAGGKSIALKSIGAFQLMLALGIPIPVDERSSFPFFEKLFVDIGDSQSAADDLSTYASHLFRLNSMLSSADRDSLILIDEAGTGTDPEEGSALFQAVLEQLSELRARTVVTTHHSALKIYAHESENAANGSMIFDQQSLAPTFRYQSGQPGSSFASELAKLVGLPEKVISRARALLGVDRADVSSFLSMLQLRIEELESETDDLRTSRKKSETTREMLARRIEKLQDERESILSRAMSDAENIVRGANRTIERVVREIRESDAGKAETRRARQYVADLRNTLLDKQKRLAKKRAAPDNDLSLDRLPDTGTQGGGFSSTSGRDQGGMASLKLTVGDQVRLDESTAVGEISELAGDKATVLFGSAQIRVKTSRLERVSGPTPQRVSVRRPRSSSAIMADSRVRNRVDVRGMRVSEALAEVTSVIDLALVAGLESVDIIHGKGTGALRMAIQEQIGARTDTVRWEEAHPDQGGAGVTRVWLNP